MTQLDLILETYVHAPATAVASKVNAPDFVRKLWTQWNVVVEQDRGPLGLRWALDDTRYTGTCEVWIEATAVDGCVLHTFARVDPVRGRISAWSRRRTRSAIVEALWRLKDDVEDVTGRADR